DTHPGGEHYEYLFVLIHGNISSLVYWKDFVNSMTKLDNQYRLIYMDLRGFGRSQQISKVDSVQDLSEDVHNLLVQILPNLQNLQKKLFLVGWSLGGLIAMQLAVDYSEIYQQLILVASAGVIGYPVMQEDEQGQIPMKCQTKEQILNTSRIKVNSQKIKDKDIDHFNMVFDIGLFNSGKKPSQEKKELLIQETFLQTNYADICWALNIFDISGGKLDQAKNIKGPILIYHGALDIIIQPIVAKGNVIEIGEDKCKLVIREGIGHMPPIEDPDDLAKEIQQFINEL
ncbi:hypothetical protein pb186bvf_019276, partial [Paramecium bursaria]